MSYIGYEKLGQSEICYTGFRKGELQDKNNDKNVTSLSKLTQQKKPNEGNYSFLEEKAKCYSKKLS